MDAERMEEGGRRPSYSPHEHDLRMQNRVRDYDPYEIDSRETTTSGRYADVDPRGPANMKTLLADRQVAGWRKSKPSAVAHHVIRKEGPNWILIAGGALVTALGVIILRRQRPVVPQPKAFENGRPASGKEHVQQSGLSFATTRRESTGSRTSELSTDSPYSGDSYMLAHTQPQSLSEGSRVGSDWGDDECNPLSPNASYYSQFPKASSHSNRTVITPTSPPGSYRGADTSATECNDSLAHSPSARLGFSSRRDMVHRLRQQLRSRDEMILDMQAQILDQERTISLKQAHCRDLERRVEDAGRTLLEADLEIQRLRKAVADYLAGHLPDSDTLASSSVSDRSFSPNQIHPLDENFLIREAGRLAEELRVRDIEKQELERLASLKVKEHELVVQKLQLLEAELEAARNSDFGKDLLLEAYEVEQENFEDKVDNLKRLIETNTPQKPLASSKIGRRSLSGGQEILKLDHEHSSDWEENGISNAKDFRIQTRNLVRSYSTLLERNSEQACMDVISGKGQVKTDESSSNDDLSDESETDDPTFSEKLVWKLRQEVDQLSIILADHSNMISEKRLETSCLVNEFQKHNALIHDMQKRMDEDVEGITDTQEQVWENHSQYLSFSNNSTSATQVQELSHKLEQIAKKQRIEEEIADLSKHQVKIAELKQRVEKLLNKCQKLQDSNGSLDTAIYQQASKMAAAGFELAKQLNLQDQQARRTSREVQRLSASFQLSSPYVPRSKEELIHVIATVACACEEDEDFIHALVRSLIESREMPSESFVMRILKKEELRKMLQACSSESLSPPLEGGPAHPTSMSHVVSALQSRFTTGSEGKPKENGDFLFDRAISVSSAESASPTTPESEGGQTLQVEEQYVYSPGFSAPSSRKSRRGFPINSGSGKEQSAGVKKRMARGVNKCASREAEKEVVRRDSSRWVDGASGVRVSSTDASSRPSFHTFPEMSDHRKKLSTNRLSMADEVLNGVQSSDEDYFLHSAPAGNISLARSARQSTDSLSDTSRMSARSPRMTGHNVSLESSIESTKSSLGRFLFDIDTGDQVYAMNHEEDGQQEIAVRDTNTLELSPCTKRKARLDLKDVSSPLGFQDGDSFNRNNSEVSTNMLNAMRGSAQEAGNKNSRSTTSESSISIDSSFDALLSNTLDDLVRLCSTPSTPPDSPEPSSLMASHRQAFC